MPTALESLTDDLDDACMAALGETVQYAANGSAYAPVLAYVDYRDQARTLDVGRAIEQDIMVTVRKSEVAAKPPGTARITLAKRAGVTFRPVNARSDESGTHWEFEVQDVGS